MSEKALINPIRISLMLSMTEMAEIYAQESIEAIARTHPTQVNSFLSRCNTNGTFSVVQDLKSILPKIPRRYKDHVKINLQQVPPCNC